MRLPSHLFLLAAPLVCGCGASAPAGAPAAAPTAPAPGDEADVGDMGEYERLRFEFAAADDYNAYAIQLIEKVLIDEAMAAWKNGDVINTTKSLQKVLEVCPVSIEAHRRLADMYEVLLEQTDEADLVAELERLEHKHREVADGLIESIENSGDGKTKVTAYKVISISEEYMLLFYMGLSRETQALISSEEGSFDFITAVDADGNLHEIYFDISAFYK
jgi:hypothetical protein